MFNADTTSSLRRCVAIAQPTTRRLHTSTTTARYSIPLQVAMYVMSEISMVWCMSCATIT